MINIHSDSNSGAEIHHLATASQNLIATTILPDNSRKTACFYCSGGYENLAYTYTSEDKFDCHNFACENDQQSNAPRNCGMHGSSEWFIPLS